MSRKFRTLAIVAAAALTLIVLILAGAFYAIQTNWFRNHVRQKVVAEIERSSGGAVELGSFDYDWRTLTAEFRDLVVHGTEQSGALPLFRADSIRIRLKIVSVFKKDIDLASIVVHRPIVHLLVAPDGSTNIPSPKFGRRSTSDTLEGLLNLKMRHFEIDGGALQIADRSVPLSARGEDLSLRLTYDLRGPHYNVNIASERLHIDAEQWPSLNAQFNATAQLERDRLLIRRAIFLSGSSKLEASGTVRHFAHPIADFEIASAVSGADLPELSSVRGVHGGEFALNGTAHYDESTPFTFSGTVAGHHVGYRSASLVLKNIEFRSDLLASRQGAQLTRLNVAAGGAHLTGRAVLLHYRQLQLDGTLAGLSIAEAGNWVGKQSLPWAGVMSGPLHAQASLKRSPSLLVQTRLQIAPASGGLPLSGDLDVTYDRRSNVVEFGVSHVNLANTQMSFSGTLGARLQLVLDSRNLEDFRPALGFLGFRLPAVAFPILLSDESAHFDGTIAGSIEDPQIAGNLALARFRLQGETWDHVRSRIAASSGALEFSSAVIDQGPFHATTTGRVALDHWRPNNNSPVRLVAQFRGADMTKLIGTYTNIKLPIMAGLASGAINIEGSLLEPHGNAQVTIDKLDAYGERLNQIQMTASLDGDQVQITRGRLQAGPAAMSFSGTYKHAYGTWREGDVQTKIDSNGFPLASLAPVRKYEPGLNAQFEIHAHAEARVTPDGIEPRNADGTAVFRRITVKNVPYGNVTLNAVTRRDLLDTSLSGDLRGSHVSGAAQVHLIPGYPAKGELVLDRIQLSTLNAIVNPSPR